MEVVDTAALQTMTAGVCTHSVCVHPVLQENFAFFVMWPNWQKPLQAKKSTHKPQNTCLSAMFFRYTVYIHTYVCAQGSCVNLREMCTIICNHHHFFLFVYLYA